MRDPRKTHYWAHASDPMYHPMKMVIARLRAIRLAGKCRNCDDIFMT